jgi:hypothetical protein
VLREFFDRAPEPEHLHQARAGRHTQGSEQQQHRPRAVQYHGAQLERGLARRGADRAARVHDREHARHTVPRIR